MSTLIEDRDMLVTLLLDMPLGTVSVQRLDSKLTELDKIQLLSTHSASMLVRVICAISSDKEEALGGLDAFISDMRRQIRDCEWEFNDD